MAVAAIIASGIDKWWLKVYLFKRSSEMEEMISLT